MKRKRLFFDIEVSPLTVYTWNIGQKISLSHDNILEERAIVCISYKWEGEEYVHNLTWDRNNNDKKMLQAFVKVMDEADEVVGHNGDGFDIPWIRGRCLVHGITMSPTISSIDTLKLARKYFRLPSNRLDYLAKLLLGEGKKETGYNLWKEVCGKDKIVAADSLIKMVDYCDKDVILLERVFEKLNVYVPNKVKYVLDPSKNTARHCPECSSNKTYCSKTKRSAVGTVRKQMQCKDCGKYFTISEAAYNKK
jgi:DNA polymerase elongation subunit (family B)